MHLHKYEKIWLVFGMASLVLFLLIIGFAAFWKGTHPQSHIETIDPQNVEAHDAFKPENLGIREVADGKYIVNIVASASTMISVKTKKVMLLKRFACQKVPLFFFKLQRKTLSMASK